MDNQKRNPEPGSETMDEKEGPRSSSEDPATDTGANEEQLLYAKILAVGMYFGLGILLVTFCLYLLGIPGPGVPIEELPRLWTLRAHEYLEAVNHQFLHREEVLTGWRWVFVLNRGDYLNFVGIAVLAAVTIVCYMGVLPKLLKKRDWIYAGIAVLEIVILLLAASGVVSVGH